MKFLLSFSPFSPLIMPKNENLYTGIILIVSSLQVRYHKKRSQHVKDEVEVSEWRVHTAKAGYLRPRPLSAPDLSMYDTTESVNHTSDTEPRHLTVYEMAGHLFTKQPKRVEGKSIDFL